MWKRDEVVRPPDDRTEVEEHHALSGITGRDQPRRSPAAERSASRDVVNIGKSVIIKGELSGSENLTIEGQFEGKIELRENVLTVGPNGRIKADLLLAKSVDVLGRVTGKITAIDVVSIRENGSVDGDITSPRIAIADGAHFRGNVDMRRDAVDAPSREPVGAKASAAPKAPPVVPVKPPAPPGHAPAPRMGRAAGGRQAR